VGTRLDHAAPADRGTGHGMCIVVASPPQIGRAAAPRQIARRDQSDVDGPARQHGAAETRVEPGAAQGNSGNSSSQTHACDSTVAEQSAALAVGGTPRYRQGKHAVTAVSSSLGDQKAGPAAGPALPRQA
jgi:hypothetical protein